MTYLNEMLWGSIAYDDNCKSAIRNSYIFYYEILPIKMKFTKRYTETISL